MPDPTDILGWYRFDDHLTSSGQPSEDQLRALSRMGVRHIVNLGLHTHERALPDEAATVAAFGMTYIHIPVEFDAPGEDDFQRFCAVLQELNGQTVHVHCILNARASAFLYRYRREALGVPKKVARDALEEIWSPGGVWAAFIGDLAAVERPHHYHVQGT